MKKHGLLVASIFVLLGASGSLGAMKRKRSVEDDDVNNRFPKKRKIDYQPEKAQPVLLTNIQQLERMKQFFNTKPQLQIKLSYLRGNGMQLECSDGTDKGSWIRDLIKIKKSDFINNSIVKLVVRDIRNWKYSEEDKKNIALIKKFKNLEIVELYFHSYNASDAKSSYLEAVASLKNLKHLTVESIRYINRALEKISYFCKLESLTLKEIRGLNNEALRNILSPICSTLKELSIVDCRKDIRSTIGFDEKGFEVLAECHLLEKLVIKDDEEKKIDKEGLIAVLQKCSFGDDFPKLTFNGEYLGRQWKSSVLLSSEAPLQQQRQLLQFQQPHPQQQLQPSYGQAFPSVFFPNFVVEQSPQLDQSQQPHP